MPHHELLCTELMKRISDRMEKQANDKLGVFDVTSTQMRMLMCLYDLGDNAVSLKALERYFGVAQSTMAGVVVRLEKKNLITSYPDPDDRRVKMVRMTDDGRTICGSVAENIEESEEYLLTGLNDEERKTFRSLLYRVYQTME